jgi:signal transduction histidine kinase
MSNQAGTAYRYAGPDRRQPIPQAAAHRYVACSFLVGIAVLAAWCALVALARDDSGVTRHMLAAVARAVSGGLLLAAAALRLAVWRVTGRARAAWASVILGVAGIAAPVLPVIGVLAATRSGVTADLAHDVVHLALITLAACLLITPPVVSRLHPSRIGLALLGIAVAMIAVLVHGTPFLQGHTLHLTSTTLDVIVTIAWFALAGAFVIAGRRHQRRGDVAIGAAVSVIGMGLAARLVGGVRLFAGGMPQSALELLAATAIAGISAAAMWQLQTGRSAQLLTVTDELYGTRTTLGTLERDRARTLHDARTTILAISGATRMLARPESSNGVDRVRLVAMVSAELHRLDTLLGADGSGEPRAVRRFSPREVIEPLVLGHRLAGADITADYGERGGSADDANGNGRIAADGAIWTSAASRGVGAPESGPIALGRPEAAATAVANVLSNARTHAPGAHVRLALSAEDDVIRIRVADDGPGIPPAERERVMGYGCRGTSPGGPGSGIGLATAAETLSDQGGSLRIDSNSAGGTVITMTLRRDPDDPRAEQPAREPQDAAPDPAPDLAPGCDAAAPLATGFPTAQARLGAPIPDDAPTTPAHTYAHA